MCKLVTSLVGLFASVLLVTGCGTQPTSLAQPTPPTSQVQTASDFTLLSVYNQDGEVSQVYEVQHTTVSAVAHEFAQQEPFARESVVNNQQVLLVYPGELVNIQGDPGHPGDVIVEVDNTAFVQHYYSPSFLDMYLTYKLLDTFLFTPSYHPYHTVVVNKYYHGYASAPNLVHYTHVSNHTVVTHLPALVPTKNTVIHRSTTTTSTLFTTHGGQVKSSGLGSTHSNRAPPTLKDKNTIIKRSGSSASYFSFYSGGSFGSKSRFGSGFKSSFGSSFRSRFSSGFRSSFRGFR